MTHIMIGKLFTLIPIGNIAWRVNLMSAFFGALAVANVYLITRINGGWRAAGISAAALLALLEGFWWRALIAESYAPSAGFLSSVWLLVLLWDQSGNWPYLFLAGMLGGLSVGIHSTVVMTSASVLLVMGLRARTRSAWLGAAGGAILGTLLTICAFLYIDHHNPASSVYNTVYVPNLSLYHLTAAQFDTPFERLFAIFPANHFWTYYFSASTDVMRYRLNEYLTLFPAWAWILIIPGIFALLIRRRWQEGLYPLVSYLLVWGLAVTVSFSIYHEFYVPAAVFVAVWMGAGASALLNGLDRLVAKFHGQGRAIHRIAIGTVCLALIALPVWNARDDLRSSVEKGYPGFVVRDHIYPVFAPDKAVKDATKFLNKIKPNGIVFADWDKLYSYVYTAELVANRNDVTFHEYLFQADGSLPQTMLAYLAGNITKRPIYITTRADELSQWYTFVPVDDSLYLLQRK
jgi:hypothetical protein